MCNFYWAEEATGGVALTAQGHIVPRFRTQKRVCVCVCVCGGGCGRELIYDLSTICTEEINS